MTFVNSGHKLWFSIRYEPSNQWHQQLVRHRYGEIFTIMNVKNLCLAIYWVDHKEFIVHNQKSLKEIALYTLFNVTYC